MSSRKVFLVNGRDSTVARAMGQFLQKLDVEILSWESARKRTRKATSFIGDILNSGMRASRATIVLLTGDDEARLRPQFRRESDPLSEQVLSPQPRPNVIYEAGMAMGRNSKRVVFVQIGNIRPFSDISGFDILRMDDSRDARETLISRLEDAMRTTLTRTAGWEKAGTFVPNPTRTIVLLDSLLKTHVYSARDRREGRTNADTLRAILRRETDWDLRIYKELTNPKWDGADQVVLMRPDLLIVHLSAFNPRTTVIGPRKRLHQFLRHVLAHKEWSCRVLVYSREPLHGESRMIQVAWKRDISRVKKLLRTGRVGLYILPASSRQDFHDEETANDFVAKVRELLP